MQISESFIEVRLEAEHPFYEHLGLVLTSPDSATKSLVLFSLGFVENERPLPIWDIDRCRNFRPSSERIIFGLFDYESLIETVLLEFKSHSVYFTMVI